MIKRPNSTISIRSKNFGYNTTNKFNIQNNYYDLNQSPKVSSNKLRPNLEGKKLFSLIDINEKITNSKGTSVPNQFKRLTDAEIHKFFNGNDIKNYEKMEKLKNALFKRLKIPIKESNTNICSEESNKKSEKTLNINNTENNKNNEISKRPKTSIYSPQEKLAQLSIKNKQFEDKKDNVMLKSEKDRWMPTNYRNYEKIVKNRQLFNIRMNENPFYNRLPSCTMKDIQSRIYKTDIFFTHTPKAPSCVKNYNNKDNQVNYCYYNSDIFNIKNDDISVKKIGEKYLFNFPQNLKYTSARESKSQWEAKFSEKGINNCSSTKYNILIPNRKNSNLSRNEIYNKLTQENITNPLYKQKGVSKYIDLANNSSSNFGKDYMKCYNINSNCFKKIQENCSSYGDLYLHYKNISDAPFYKKKVYY